jgi:orotidine-5'-phosphate decarboxylase
MTLKKTADYISKNILSADAKRGDIGNTSTQYAELFDSMGFDAITVAPYEDDGNHSAFAEMGHRARTHINPGAHDFEMLETDGVKLYEFCTKCRNGTPRLT